MIYALNICRNTKIQLWFINHCFKKNNISVMIINQILPSVLDESVGKRNMKNFSNQLKNFKLDIKKDQEGFSCFHSIPVFINNLSSLIYLSSTYHTHLPRSRRKQMIMNPIICYFSTFAFGMTVKTFFFW